MMKNFWIVAIVCALASCGRHDTTPLADTYQDTTLWYGGLSDIDTSRPDVFYVLPTSIRDWTDSLGIVHHHADVRDPKQRRRMDVQYRLAEGIFGQDANFFAPYYRQVSMDTWTTGSDTINARFQLAMSDIREAFGYYMEHLNHGRRFFLAGFSQGGMCVAGLLREMGSAADGKLIAAYICGYKITARDLENHPGKFRPAQSDSDTGVVIVINSATDPSAICDIVTAGNQMAINPASWSRDTVRHQLNDSLYARLDTASNVLIISGMDARNYYSEKLGMLFPEGCLHLYELDIWGDAIRENMKVRAQKVMK